MVYAHCSKIVLITWAGKSLVVDNRSDDETSEDENLIDFDHDAFGEVKRFRLLIIGRSGCGKTTILSKVCKFPISLNTESAKVLVYRCAERKW